MATDFAETCSVCTDEFDNSHRQSVSLPCGHDFCLSCLVHLRSKSKHKCPRCRRNWAKIALPMEALATALESDQDDEEDDMDKKKDKDHRCKKHSSPYDFWVNAKKEFYCRKCAAEDKSGVELTIIEEAVPQIQVALAADVPEAKKRLEDGLESLDEKHANLVKKRNSVRKLSEAVKALEGNFDQEIEQVAAQRTRALNSSAELNKVEKKIPNITSPADLGAAMECKNTLKRVGAPFSVSTTALPQTLLSIIACSYEEGATSESPPSKALFVNAMLNDSFVVPLTDKDSSSASIGSSCQCLQSNGSAICISGTYGFSKPDNIHSIAGGYVGGYIDTDNSNQGEASQRIVRTSAENFQVTHRIQLCSSGSSRTKRDSGSLMARQARLDEILG